MTTMHYETQDRLKADWQMLLLILAHVPVVGFLVPIGYGTTLFAITASLLIAALAWVGYTVLKGTRGYSVLVAACLMLFSTVMIQAQMGRIEMHFHIFAALAFTLIYKDWLPVLVAAGTIVVHHLLLTALQLSGASLWSVPVMIFNYGCSWPIAFLHAAFVIFEASVLIVLSVSQRSAQMASYGIIDAINKFQKNKDLSVRVTGANNSPAVISFNHMMTDFSDLVTQLKSATDLISGGSALLTTLSTQTQRVVQQQSEQTSQAATATQQMSATVHHIAQNASAAAQATELATTEADNGAQAVQRSIAATATQNKVLSQTAASVNALSDSVGRIGEMTAAIEAISQQTNLLALNAAIEAARAGDAGRGFSVVADEVRNLSVQTQQSTVQIQDFIVTLRAGTESAIVSMQEGQKRANETAEYASVSGGALDRISVAISTVQQMNSQIAVAAEQQSAASEHLNRNVQAISGQGTSVAEKATDLVETTMTLNNTLAAMKITVSGYKTA